MEEASGKYILVKAITKEEAISLAEELFDGEGAKLWAEGTKLWAEGTKLMGESIKLWAEGAKLWAEGNKLWAELAIQYCGYIPDRRAMNFIAADREDGVYCFVWSRKEIWFYDGKNCPHAEKVEVVWTQRP